MGVLGARPKMNKNNNKNVCYKIKYKTTLKENKTIFFESKHIFETVEFKYFSFEMEK